MTFTTFAAVFAAFGAGLFAGLFLLRRNVFDERELMDKAGRLEKEAKSESERLVEKSRESVTERKKKFTIEQEEFLSQMNKLEQALTIKTLSFQKREAKVAELQRALQAEEASVLTLQREAEKGDEAIHHKLLAVTGVSVDAAKQEIIARYEQDFAGDAEARLKGAIEWAQECAVRDARNVLSEAICRFGDIKVSTEHGEGRIKVPHDDMKGKLIGRGGRTIAFIEQLFDVDVVFNDEPNVILVGCFNLVQRETARLAIERLLREKNITEEIIVRTKGLAEQDMTKILVRVGRDALQVLGLKDLPDEFAKLVGRLKFRTSYGQNVLRHSFEVGYLARLLAGAAGADEHVALLGGFFHDIGKSIDQEVGGSHDALSKEILEKYGFSWEITHAAWTHHNAIPQETAEARIVQAADAISAGRPGARAESLERYIAKIKDLEETVLSFAGTKKVFTINAGREVRVLVEPDKMNDAGAKKLAVDIAAKVQEKGGYPGRIKIITIRNTKATDFAR